jgi:hypothetical protein
VSLSQKNPNKNPANGRVSATDETVRGTRLQSPLTTESLKRRLTLKAKRFSGQIISHFKVLIYLQVFYGGEPEKGFAVSLPRPFNSIISISMLQNPDILVFSQVEESIMPYCTVKCHREC